MRNVLALVLIVLALVCIGMTCYEVLAGTLDMFEPKAIVAYPFHAACMIGACMLMAPRRVPQPKAPEPADIDETDKQEEG